MNRNSSNRKPCGAQTPPVRKGKNSVSEKPENQAKEKDHYLGLGMAIGMIAFAPLGVVLAIATDTLGLLGIGPAMGVAVGIALGEGFYRRSLRNHEEKNHESD